MRILQIVDTLGIGYGVSSIVINLYRKLCKGDTQIDFLVCRKSKYSYEEEILKNGSKIYFVGNPLTPREIFSSLRKCKNFFKEHASEYDIVHLHSPTLNEFTLRFAKKYNIRHRIIHSHSSMTSPSLLKKFANALLLLNKTRYATDLWTCSTPAAHFLYGEKKCRNSEVELIINAIDTKAFYYSEQKYNDMRQEYNITDRIVITHISNFSYIKNHKFLVDVIKECVSINNAFLFVFVGDGPTRIEFENEIIKYGLSDNVKFAGKHTDVLKFYNISDLVILPSLKEGLPLTVVEAQSCGVPCFVSDTITREANVGGVTYIPLEKQKWIDCISTFKPYNTHQKLSLSECIDKSNFNIENEAVHVYELYMNMMK